MKNSDQSHLGDLRILYVENLLSPDELKHVEEHLQGCLECRKDVEEIGTLTKELKQTVISCPEPWEIFDYSRGISPNAPEMSLHVKSCGKCEDELKQFLGAGRPSMPKEILSEIENSFPLQKKSDRQSLLDFISFFRRKLTNFSIPTYAATAAVAASLILILITNLPGPKTVIYLSPVQWGNSVIQKNLMGPGSRDFKPSVGIIISSTTKTNLLDSNKTASIYQALEPDSDLYDKFRILSPSDIYEVTKRKDVSNPTLENLLSIGVDYLLVVNLSDDKQNRAEINLFETGNNKIIESIEIHTATRSDLSESLRTKVAEMLLRLRPF
jgi:hypothetical protein